MTLAEDQRLNTLLFSLLKRLDQAQDGMAYLMPVHDPLWNDAAIHGLHEAGILKKGQPFSTILCDGCDQLCPMPVQHYLDDAGKIESSFIACDKREDIGLVPVEACAMHPYTLTLESLATMLAQQFGSDRSPEELEAGRLWFLGKEGFGKEKRGIYLFSGAGRPDAETSLRDHSHIKQHAQPIILTPAATLSIPSAVNASLQNVMAFEGGALQFDLSLMRQKKRQQKQDEQYMISYDVDRNDVLLNDTITFAHVRPDCENERVIRYFTSHPNQDITLNQLEEACGSLSSNWHKNAYNMGFRGIVKKAFFKGGPQKIRFNNPVTLQHLHRLGIKPSDFRAEIKKKSRISTE